MVLVSRENWTLSPSCRSPVPAWAWSLLLTASRPRTERGRFFRSGGSDGAKMWEEIPQKQCCAAQSAGAAQYSLQLLDPKRVVQAVAAAGNWRHRRTVSVMASKVQIWFQQNRKKEQILPSYPHLFASTIAGFELNWTKHCGTVIVLEKMWWKHQKNKRVVFVMSVFCDLILSV